MVTTLVFVKLLVLGLKLGVDFTFTLDNNNNHNNHNENNPHLNFFKGTVLGVKEQELGIRDKGWGSSVKGKGIRPKWSLTLKTKSCSLYFCQTKSQSRIGTVIKTQWPPSQKLIEILMGIYKDLLNINCNLSIGIKDYPLQLRGLGNNLIKIFFLLMIRFIETSDIVTCSSFYWP